MTTEIRKVVVENTQMRVAYPYTRLNETVVREILEGKAYPPPPLAAGIAIERIADIGAHIGTAAVWFHHLWPNAQIHCFEPSLESVEFLKTNSPFAQFHPYALAGEDRQAKLFKPGQGTVLNSLKGNEGDFELVDCHRASELCQLKPDLIKLDTEGCELEIICEALPAFLAAKVLYLEYHNWHDRVQIEHLIQASTDKRKKILFSASVGWTINRGELAYIDRDAIDPKTLTQWAL
jgi:FkbM family methyltransferase